MNKAASSACEEGRSRRGGGKEGRRGGGRRGGPGGGEGRRGGGRRGGGKELAHRRCDRFYYGRINKSKNKDQMPPYVFGDCFNLDETRIFSWAVDKG